MASFRPTDSGSAGDASACDGPRPFSLLPPMRLAYETTADTRSRMSGRVGTPNTRVPGGSSSSRRSSRAVSSFGSRVITSIPHPRRPTPDAIFCHRSAPASSLGGKCLDRRRMCGRASSVRTRSKNAEFGICRSNISWPLRFRFRVRHPILLNSPTSDNRGHPNATAPAAAFPLPDTAVPA